VGEKWRSRLGKALWYCNLGQSILAPVGQSVGEAKGEVQKRQKTLTLLQTAQWFGTFNTFKFAKAYAGGEGMKHYVEMVQEPEFAAREQGYTFVSHQQEVGTGYFDDVTTVIQGGSSSVKALTGSTEEEQFR